MTIRGPHRSLEELEFRRSFEFVTTHYGLSPESRAAALKATAANPAAKRIYTTIARCLTKEGITA